MSLQLRARVPERGVELDLAVAGGQTLALIGPNGAGKSTVLSLVAGTLRPARGQVELDGQLLFGERAWTPPHHRRVTTLSQDPVLFPHLTTRGNIMFPLRSQGVPRTRARTEAGRWLAELGLEDLADRRPAMLSGGQAQRVAIARALAADPRLLLLDEPMAALDIDVAVTLRGQLRRFLADRTAIIVTHDVLDALTLADHLAVLDEGRVIEQGPTRELLTRPRTAFTASFAGLNLVTGRWEAG
ncbi:MAG: ATP-binding cassette domain-containing protein, partial [Brachybacterium sp.]|nr:ATP-binding cassette domain-containing protein [Brachybacterium sp.]